MPDAPMIDYTAFHHRLVEALRKAWTQVRGQRPTESFYMFGVETDADAVVLNLFCNTEEQFSTEHETSEYEIEKWAVDQDSELYGAGEEFLDDLQDEVNQYVHLKEPQPESVFEERKRNLMQIFERALADLDAEQFFGSGNDRHRVVLSVEIVDADEEEWDTMIDIMKRINPPESLARFLELLKEQDDPVDEN